MTRSKEFVDFALGLGLMLSLLGFGSANAELLVKDVTGVEGIMPGARFPDDHVFNLPLRSEIKLIRVPDNTSFVMRGRFEGTLSKFIKDCTGFFGSLTAYCKENPAGDLASPGGTRSLRPSQ
jgi:hypothetical protein